MQYLKKGILFIAGLVTITSCSEENPWQGSGEEGGIRLHLSTDGKVFSGGETRADEGIVIPSTSDFKIRMTRTDGSGYKEFESIEAFEKEGGFPVGEYYLRAYYGDIAEEGFECPYFIGREIVQIQPAEVSEVDVTTRLANSMVKLNFSDEFKNVYSAYSAALTTLSSPVFVAQNEDRVAYVQPEEVYISLSLTNAAGKEVTFQPASFVAEPQHRYNVNFSLEPGAGNNGSLSLNIVFDDNVTSEIVQVDLSDDLFNSPSPEVRPIGFSNGDSFSIIQNDKIESNPRFHLFAFGGIAKLKEATLSVSSSGLVTDYVPSFGKSVNLIEASDMVQSMLESEGVKVSGIFRNPDKMAVIDIADFISNLPQGTHTISLKAVDQFTRLSETVTITVTVGDLLLEAAVRPGEEPVFMGDELILYVTTNSSGVKDKLTFEVSTATGAKKVAKIKKVEEVASENGNHCYKYILTVDKNDTSSIDVNILNGSKNVASLKVDKRLPEFTVEADAFANYVLLKVTPGTGVALEPLMNVLNIRNGSSAVASSRIVKDTDKGIIRINGLVSNETYSNMQIGAGSSYKPVSEFTTEEITGVPNGDFENLQQTIGTNMNQGGLWTITVNGTNHQITLAITVQEPVGWASTNAKTMSSSTANSWFKIPSAYATNISWLVTHPNAKVLGQGDNEYTDTPPVYENLAAYSGSNAMIVRNVGWDPEGVVPSRDSHTGNANHSNYYNRNVPDYSAVSVGKIFLGSYSYSNGNETYNQGVVFKSRPAKLKGYYKYELDENDSSEKAYVSIQIMSGNDIIATKSLNLPAAENYTPFELSLTYNKFNVKPTHLRIMISSSNHASMDMDQETNNVKVSTYCTKQESSFRGAQLTVDNLTFEY